MRATTRLIAAAGAALLAGSTVFTQQDFQWRGRVAPGQTIEIKGVNGGVHAVLANSNEVEVTAVRTARRSNPDHSQRRNLRPATHHPTCSCPTHQTATIRPARGSFRTTGPAESSVA